MLHDLPGEVQRHVATFALEGGSREVRNGDRFLGSDRNVLHEQRRCKCGLCVSTDGPSTSSSCILVDGGLRAVRREKTTEICLVVCQSRYPLRMILKFIAGLLRAVVVRMPEGVEDSFASACSGTTADPPLTGHALLSAAQSRGPH